MVHFNFDCWRYLYTSASHTYVRVQLGGFRASDVIEVVWFVTQLVIWLKVHICRRVAYACQIHSNRVITVGTYAN